jgi:excinuclease ABC subunit B
MPFRLHAPYEPAGDQPEAIRQLTDAINGGEQFQTLTRGYGIG